MRRLLQAVAIGSVLTLGWAGLAAAGDLDAALDGSATEIEVAAGGPAVNGDVQFVASGVVACGSDWSAVAKTTYALDWVAGALVVTASTDSAAMSFPATSTSQGAGCRVSAGEYVRQVTVSASAAVPPATYQLVIQGDITHISGASTPSFDWRNRTIDVKVTGSTPVVTYGGEFLSPVDGSGVINVVKQGRVVPVKLEIFEYLDNVKGSEVKTGTVKFTQRSGNCQAGAPTDPVVESAGSSNAGNEFRFVVDGAEDYWQFNLATKNLSLGCTNFDIWYGTAKVATFILNVTK